MSSKKGLGRSFESLIPDDLFDESFDSTSLDNSVVSDLRMINIDSIKPDKNQPRKHFDDEAHKELTKSIELHGVLQPIVVVPVKNGGYSIVAGERRWRASKAAGLAKIPTLVRTLTSQHKLELSIIENVQRHNLSPLETARAFSELREKFNLSLEEIGSRVGGKSVSAVSNTLRLLRLPEKVQDALQKRDITEGQARPLIDLSDDVIDEILPKIIQEQWSARTIEKNVASRKAQKPSKARGATGSSNFKQLQNYLTQKLGRNVNVIQKRNNKGEIRIEFSSEDDLDKLKQQLLS
ncbi:ParB/RepB/Spo0J family partition protein [Candidatus Saccharibacteria bacterium]|jgi:ParB family chromosome partitioning protein|nr:ParB/RepB/Spo0J family partition protein [Candidatus Saccharibacteria bacterium]